MTSNKDIRVRFAPSPTGGLHPGNARIAIFNTLFVQHERTIGNNSKYVLRMEDTDEERSTLDHETSIINDLKWLGITWDEGPFRQSERTKRYTELAEELLKRGFLYKCYCTEEDLEQERASQVKAGKPPRYKGKCKNLTAEERTEKEKNTKNCTLRFDVDKFINDLNSSNDMLSFHDLIKNKEATSVMSNPLHVIGDFVVMKQSGTPTYNFAVVVDDIDMNITHVFRGEDHVSNTFRQIMIFLALGVKKENLPKYGHLPMLLAPDKTKLSKRSGGIPIHEYRKMGFLAEAMFNHLAFLGGGIKILDETADKELIAKTFEYEHTASSACVYDVEKLRHINAKFISKLDPAEALALLLRDMSFNADWKKYYNEKDFIEIVSLSKEGTRTLLELISNIDLFMPNPVSEEDFIDKNTERDQIIELLFNHSSVSGSLISGSDWKGLKEKIVSSSSLTGGKLFKTLRVILTGKKDGPPLDSIMIKINNNIVVERIKKVKELVG
ncbi:MAG: glutamate--tRNA ligase [bacterium]